MLKTHKLFDRISNEVHARPFQKIEGSLCVLHLGMSLSAGKSTEAVDVIRNIAKRLGVEETIDNQYFFFVRSKDIGLRFEKHNEFYTLTLYHFGAETSDILHKVWLPLLESESLPGTMFAGVDILYHRRHNEKIPNLKQSQVVEEVDGHQVVSSNVMASGARIVTNFTACQSSNLIQILIEDYSLRNFQAGRLLQRICEIETYRHIALFSLPEAQKLMPNLTKLDKKLSKITHKLTAQDEAEPSEILNELMKLSSKVEEISAETSNRFAASEAYFSLLDERLEELHEESIEGFQTITQFMERRLRSARRTCRAAALRVGLLSERIARVIELVRSQVDVSIEQQNTDLLAALNGRTHRQLRLQAKMESFTIIVVTYYLFDLVERTIRNSIQIDALRDNILMWLGFSVPLVAGAVWLYVRHLLKGYDD